MRLRIRRIDRRQQIDLAFLLTQRIEHCLRMSWIELDGVTSQSWRTEAARAMAAYRSITRRAWYAANPGRLVAMRDEMERRGVGTGQRW